MSKPLPSAYKWLEKEPGPRILTEFIKVFGTEEDTGNGSNPTILAWAAKVGLGKVYKDDATAWCGLAMAYVAGQAGWENAPRGNALLARNWAHWGNPAVVPMLGDVMVFWRGKREGIQGHVGIYVGEDDEAFHILGGNQGDKVSIARLARDRLLQARRCPWRIREPLNTSTFSQQASKRHCRRGCDLIQPCFRMLQAHPRWLMETAWGRIDRPTPGPRRSCTECDSFQSTIHNAVMPHKKSSTQYQK